MIPPIARLRVVARVRTILRYLLTRAEILLSNITNIRIQVSRQFQIHALNESSFLGAVLIDILVYRNSVVA
jgi:hypothetical protein